MRVSAAPPDQAVSRRVYQAIDWSGWTLLVVLAAIFVATGLSIHAALHATHHPVLGDLAVVIASGVALLWASFLYCFRVSARIIITNGAFTVTHGLWRHQIAWTDVERVGEWTTLNEGIRMHWLAIWSIDGMRVQAREDLVGSYETFRTDVMRCLSHSQDAPPAVSDLTQPLVVREDRGAQVGIWGALSAVGLIGGGLIWRLLPAITGLGIVVLILGGVSLVITLLLVLLRQQLTIGPAGVTSTRGIFTRHIPWAAIYVLDRERAKGNGSGAAGVLLRGLVMVLFRIDKRSAVILGPVRPHSTITIRGGTGERISIDEQRYLHPAWLRARLRAEIDALREKAAPLMPQVSPLPPSGPLAPGTVLPPDPLEGSSTLWLRESGDTDPFRGRG